MTKEDLYYKTHVFMCTNKGSPEKPMSACGQKGSEELRHYMRDAAKAAGLDGTRINVSGCLGRCRLGPAMVIYPEGIWFTVQNQSDVDAVIDGIKTGNFPQRLRLEPQQRELGALQKTAVC